jgi:aldose 1-epimerase
VSIRVYSWLILRGLCPSTPGPKASSNLVKSEQTMCEAPNYSAARVSLDGVEVVRLTDARHNTQVSVVPTIGNNAFEMKVNGTNVFWTPYGNPAESLAEFRARPVHLGNLLLAPWANRLDGDAFWANGRKYLLNAELNNLHRDGNGLPIHGLLEYSDRWEVVALEATEFGAYLTSRLEFWRHPDYMAQFPFAHAIEITYRLEDGALDTHMVVTNRAAAVMPLSVAFHPYFTLTDAPRDEWSVRIPARELVVVDDRLLPTGAREPAGLSDVTPLKDRSFDTVFSGVNAAEEFEVRGRKQRIALRFGPKYPVAVVYAPPGRDFICFEPMSGVTNAFNLAERGLYPQLQTIPPGGKWEESFRILPSGF